ncbi:hypothetical protein [Nocardia brasiliensis]|nr:hypothetical protein [Nocardia brasiliensis]
MNDEPGEQMAINRTSLIYIGAFMVAVSGGMFIRIIGRALSLPI